MTLKMIGNHFYNFLKRSAVRNTKQLGSTSQNHPLSLILLASGDLGLSLMNQFHL